MAGRSPTCSYSTPALEAWFDRLQSSWEDAFSTEELSAGRAIYREGTLRSLDLSRDDAVAIHGDRGETVHAVVEWGDRLPEVRASVTDRAHSRSLGVATLYEIEELVADRIAPLSWEEPAQVAGERPHANGSSPEKVDAEPRRERTIAAAPPKPAPQLAIEVRADRRGIFLDVRWLEEGTSRKASLEPAGGPADPHRAAVIRVLSAAHRCGFRYQRRTRRLVLREIPAIQSFLQEQVPEWRKRWPVTIDSSAAPLTGKARTGRLHATILDGEQPGRTARIRWAIEVDGQRLDDSDSEALLRNPSRPGVIPGRGIVALPDEEAGILDDWIQSTGHRDGSVPLYLTLSLFSRGSLLLQSSPAVAAWKARLLREPPSDSVLPRFLRDYQKRGVHWMAHLLECSCAVLLADEMGLGKTVQALALLDRGERTDPDIIICPASVIPVWEAEIQRFFPHWTAAVVCKEDDFVDNPKPIVWLCSYTQLRRRRQFLAQTAFRCAVLDEGQFIKNPDSKVSQAAAAIQADRRIALTGTPVENRLLDLWSIFRFLLPGLLGPRTAFEENATHSDPASRNQIRRQVAPFILRRTKSEVAHELPPKVSMVLQTPMTERQRRIYEDLAGDGLRRFGGQSIDSLGGTHRMHLLALFTRLRQAACDPGLLPGIQADTTQSGKLQVLAERVPELVSAGHKVVLFSQFVSFLDRTREALEPVLDGNPIFELRGSTRDRARPVRQFQERKGGAVFLISLRAGGTGITLHAADYVFILDPWWNPAVEDQAIDRVHRIGQDKTVLVYRLVSPESIEARVEALKARKGALVDDTVGALDDVTSAGRFARTIHELLAVDGTPSTADAAG